MAEEALGRAVRFEMLVGAPAQELARYASEHEVGILVVGTRGNHGLGRLAIGSVAERVVHEARCTVMVVHAREEAAAVP